MKKQTLLMIAGITRRLPSFFQNRRLLRLICNPNKAFGKYSDSIVEIGGLSFILNPASFIEWEILFTGYFEKNTSRLIKKLSKLNSTVIDVGANIGCHTIIMADAVGPNGRVLAFEPTPKFRNRLKKNIEINHQKNVSISEYALAEKDSESFIYFSEASTNERNNAVESGSLQSENVNLPHRIPVRIKTLDEICLNLESINLIKIDTDGGDFNVLLGAEKTIEKHRPSVIFEWDEKSWLVAGHTLKMAEDFFKKLNYTLSQVETNCLATPQ